MWCIQKPHDKMSQITMVLLCGPKPLHFIAEITKTQLHIYKEKTCIHDHWIIQTFDIRYITAFGNELKTKK